MTLVRERLVPHLEALAGRASRIATDSVAIADAADDIGDTIDGIETSFFQRWTRERMAALVHPIAVETERYQAVQLNRQLRSAVAVDVVGSEPWLGRAIDEFTHENVALIKSVGSRFFDDLESHLKREIADGTRWEELAGIIEERYGVAGSRAELIARDQVGKFFGDLNRVRQTDLGVTKFVWRTSNDNRVREEHEQLEGQVFEWANPPSEGTPGEPVGCRCNAEPDLTDLLS
jgi:SPP1 gp7 family putative phage head morphogenesis protein